MGLALAVSVELTEVSCGICGGVYAINTCYRLEKQEKGGYWTCPYCKTLWGFGKGELDRQREALQAEKERHQQTLARLNEEVAARAKSEREAKRLKTRAKSGLCPCCNRTFVNLRRHMETKHPEK